MSEISGKKSRFSDQIAHFENIEVAPRVGTDAWDTTAGPIWPDWDHQTFPRFHVNNNPRDTKPASDWSTGDPVLETGFWCGISHHHFGHMIADHSTRLLISHQISPKSTKIFSVRKNKSSNIADHILLNMICNWYGVNLDSVVLVNTPIKVKKLTVVPQQEMIMVRGPSERYLDLLDANAKRMLGTTVQSIPLVYVSRSQQEGGILGEAYLEKVFAKAGAVVIRPEELPLERQMEIYFGARKLVFSEGSAVHGLQLLGRLPSEIVILRRRIDRRFCFKALKPRAKALHYLDVGDDVLKFYFRLGLDREQLNDARKTIVVDSDQFLADMDELDIPISQYWDEKEYCRVAEEQMIKKTDHFKEAWSKNKNQAIRDEFISFVYASRFKYMAPRLEKRLSENKVAFWLTRWRDIRRFMRTLKKW